MKKNDLFSSSIQILPVIIFTCLLNLIVVSCNDKEKEPFFRDDPDISLTEYVELINYPYGKDPLQMMDVYLQKNRNSSTPLVILLHGGSWVGGDKKDFPVAAYVGAGANVININYRLANGGDILCEQIISDIHAVVTTLVELTEKWNICNNGFLMWGNSAGGHLSLLYAYAHDKHKVISAVVSFGGPTKLDDVEAFDLNQHFYLLKALTGKVWIGTEEVPPVYRHVSPYYASSYKPSFFIHGEKDTLVPLRQAQFMHSHLKQNEMDSEIVILSNAGHSGENAPQSEIDAMYLKVYEWILKHSK